MGSRVLRSLLRDRIIVTLKSGETFDGVLLESDAKLVRLVDAFAVTDKSRLSVDGELFLLWETVAYVQRPVGA